MNVSLITSVPLVPPWDQGDKNLAYALTAALPHIHFQVLTTRDGPHPVGSNLELLPLFARRRPSLVEKIGVYAWLVRRSLQPDRNNQTDVYHLIYQPSALSSRMNRLVPELKRKPLIHTIPASAAGHNLGAALLYADKVVAVSEHGRRTLAALGLQDIRCIPGGIDVKHWAEIGEKGKQLKAQMGFGGKRVLLYTGHYSSGYGIQTLLSAWPEIAAAVGEAHLVLACRMRTSSDWQEEEKVRRQLSMKGSLDSVSFLHTVADMSALIGACDVVTLPFDGMKDKVDIPTTLLEALGAGKPVVASDLAPMDELFNITANDTSSGSIGQTVRPGDAAGLAQAVIGLLANDCARQSAGRNGQRLIARHFDIAQSAKQYENLYQEVVK